MSKTLGLALLVCLNLVLLTALCLSSYSLPTAMAQGTTSLSGNYLMVAGQIQNGWDALYIIDVKTRTLHAFYWEKGRRELLYSDARSLDRDFRNKD